jgi:hypothetical protein
VALTVPLAIFFISIAFYINQTVEILKRSIGKGAGDADGDKEEGLGQPNRLRLNQLPNAGSGSAAEKRRILA